MQVPAAELPHYTTSDQKPRRWKDERHAGLAAGPRVQPKGSH
jgi:hypothetical protein